MSFRITALIYMACFAALSMGLYLVKYSVQNIQRDVLAMRSNLNQEKESLHLLKAEWAYLNRPDRLQRLASQLELVPLDTKRIGDIRALPAVHEQVESAPARSMVQPISHEIVEDN